MASPSPKVAANPFGRSSSSVGSKSLELDALCCPLTLVEFEDPVILSGDGHSYERSAILAWLEAKSTSPLTGRALTESQCQLIPNLTLKKMTDELKSQAPDEVEKAPPALPPSPKLPATRPPPPAPPAPDADLHYALKLVGDELRAEDDRRRQCARDAEKARQLHALMNQ
mmetsp:Transcript_20950/g.67482  ORF Transcript_20950/g.67482 Transcript_20950/m.67482 type:complete len:170 (-) Transcript_20950:957-1466(-)